MVYEGEMRMRKRRGDGGEHGGEGDGEEGEDWEGGRREGEGRESRRSG